MFPSIGLTVAGFIYVLVIGLFYFTKKRYTNVASSLFNFFIKIVLIFSVFEICNSLVLYYFLDTHPLFCKFMVRLYTVFSLFVLALIYLYIKSNVKDEIYSKISELFTDNLLIFSLALVFCGMIASFFTTVEVVRESNVVLVRGTYYFPIYVL